MPTYLCHGFQWPRALIRIHTIINGLDDVAPDWLLGTTTASMLLNDLADKFDFLPMEDAAKTAEAPVPGTTRGAVAEDPVLRHAWSPVKLLEEYDPADTKTHAKDYAYVADYAVRVDLGANIADEMGRYEQQVKRQGGEWLSKLRDALHKEAVIGWHVVVCGDSDREVPEEDEDQAEEDEDDGQFTVSTTRDAPPTATTDMSSIHGPEWPLPNSPHPSQDFGNSRISMASREYPSIKPPPVPVDDMPAAKPRSLRRKLSIKRLFSRKDSLNSQAEN